MSIFGEPPPEQRSAADRDRLDRCRPTDQQVEVARAMLRADPEADVVIVALAFPGKSYGFWTEGQPVEPVPGFWLAGTGQVDGDRLRNYGAARNLAESAASDYLWAHHGGEGSVAFSTIELDGDPPPVFEGFVRER